MLKFTFTILLSNLAFAVAEVLLCPSGCYCPSEEVAHCCLFPSDHPSPVQCHFPGQRQISANSNSTLRWPAMDTCLTRWTELSIKLFPGSWPPAPPKRSCTAQLRRISISGGSLTLLTAEHFQTLFGLQENHLKVLVIQNTRLENLQAGLFDRLSLKTLSEIHLNQNYNLSSKGFGISVFSSLPQLETLNLESNRIERLDFVRWGFPTTDKEKPASRLISLNLANNSLTYIKSGAFNLFPFLEMLSLANNKLSSLSSDVFEGLTSLKRLDLSGNLLNILGLKNSLLEFSITLANLNLLDISMNPLMRSVYTETAKWWLSSGCPASLTQLIMNHIDVDQGQSSPILPPIDWTKCQKLARVEIQQIPRLSCLSASWLQSDILPTHPALITSATRICTLSSTTTTTTTARTKTTTVRPRPGHTTTTTGSERLGLRELIVSSVAGAVLFLLLILFIAIVFMCRRRRWTYGLIAKGTGKPRSDVLKGGRRERSITSTYIPAPDCHLPLTDNDDGLSASSMRQTGSRILYDESGVPVCSMVVPEVGSPTAVFLADGTLAYVPQFIPLSGRATPSSHTGLLDNSYRSSRLLLKQPVMVPLMTSHTSLVTSQIDFPRQQQRPPSSSYQPLGKARSRLPSHNHHIESSNHAPTSTLSCKSTSFSSLGGSVHSEIPLHASAFSTSPPPLATVVQPTKPSIPPSSSPSAVSSTEEPSLMVGTGGAVTTASTATSTANPSPNSHSDGAVA
ncbi:Toll-like receptor 7 [Taenia crassiceps]|uniref:Toll-like receptor 7 n=1 Tax=Taenia crassiceps TaxID=6207 RepID=A0ABR4QL52_9CEST